MAHKTTAPVRGGPVDIAAHHMVRHVPTALPDETAGGLLARLPGHLFDYAETIYVIDAKRMLLGTVPLARLLVAAPTLALHELLRKPQPLIRANMDQEKVATLALVHGVSAVPVVDENGCLLGVVPPQALLQVLRHEHVEDLHRMAGIAHDQVQARAAIEEPPAQRVRDRLPWLLVGLVGSMFATLVMVQFEKALESAVAIAFFVPGIVYLAGAIGTQSETIAVRGLSLSHAPFSSLILGELVTGLLLGTVLGAIAFPVTWLIFGDLWLGMAVALALIAAGTVSTTIGLVFPWLLERVGSDPAMGSGPLATIVQDVLSLLVYFLVAAALVVDGPS